MLSNNNPRDFPAALVPGPRWLWIALFVLATGVAILQSRPVEAPDCDQRDVVRTLESLMQGGLLARAMLTGSSDDPRGIARVKTVRELGYARRSGVRACRGTLDIVGEPRPMAFTIHRDRTSARGYFIAGAAPAVLAAGYSQIHRDGSFQDFVPLIGRLHMAQAFRDGVARLHESAADSDTEIGEIEPAAPCRMVRGATVLSCRLLVERSDAALAQAGRNPATLLDSEFTFERDLKSGNWKMSPGFPDEFGRAVDAARMPPAPPGRGN